MRNKVGKTTDKVKKPQSINISEEYKMEIKKKGNTVFIKDSNITREDYEAKVFSNPSLLKTNSIYKQQSYARYSLQHFLEYTFRWDYWLVVTYGINPQKVDVDLTQLGEKELDWDRFDKEDAFNFKLPYSKREVVVRLLTHGLQKQIEAELKGLKKLKKAPSSPSRLLILCE